MVPEIVEVDQASKRGPGDGAEVAKADGSTGGGSKGEPVEPIKQAKDHALGSLGPLGKDDLLVVVGGRRIEQSRNIAGRIFAVGIHHHHHVGRGVLGDPHKAGADGPLVAHVAV